MDIGTACESIYPHVQVGYEFRAKRYLLDRGSISNNAAEYNQSCGEFKSAMKMGRESVQIRQQFLKIEHPRMLTSIEHCCFGTVTNDHGKYDEAEKCIDRRCNFDGRYWARITRTRL
jgi:hypothetical protein